MTPKGRGIKPRRAGTGKPKVTVDSTNDRKPRISFEFADEKAYCLSGCGKQNVKRCISAFRRICSQSWGEIVRTGGKGAGKSGLHFESFSADTTFKKVKRPQHLSQDRSIFSLRASQEMRIYGYREGVTLHVLWIDPRHEILPG